MRKKIFTTLFFICLTVSVFNNFVYSAESSDSAESPSAKSKSESDSKSSAEYLRMLENIFTFVQNNYVDKVDPKTLYQGALKGLMESLNDPYSVYLDESDMRNLTDTTEGNFGGVGLSITKQNESTLEKPAYVEVASPIEDTPGFRAGIKTGDKIVKIDGVATPKMSMEEVLKKLRGKVGTSVKLEILRGKDITFDVDLVRALIEVPTVKYGMIGNIGYVRIIEFTPDTPKRFQEALDSFIKNKYTGMIIDLRNNPGGLITSVVSVCDKIIDNGPIVSTKSRLKYQNSVYSANKKNTIVSNNLPIVVLINHGSASAAEILSGALKDNHRAYLIGENSYGKGSVQQVVPLYDNDGFRMTMARYYTPSDTNIDKVGIPPDLEVKNIDLSDEQEKEYVDLLKSNNIADYIDKHPHMTKKDIYSYAKKLGEKYTFDQRILRKIIRTQNEKSVPTPLYDLDYDIQLNKALSIVKSSDYQKLVAGTKTLKELQQIAAKNKIPATAKE